MVTISVIKADIGGYVGHSASHPEILDLGREEMAQQRGLLIDFHASFCGDDMFLILTHERGEDNEEIHKLAWDTFQADTDIPTARGEDSSHRLAAQDSDLHLTV